MSHPDRPTPEFLDSGSLRGILFLLFFGSLIAAKCAVSEALRQHYGFDVNTALFIWLPSLIIGAFLETRMEGREITGTLKLPRDLVRQNDTVWLVREGALAVQPVDIVFQDAEYAYIDGGLRADDQVITTNLATVKDGIRLRVRSSAVSGEDDRDSTQNVAGQAGGRPVTASP